MHVTVVCVGEPENFGNFFFCMHSSSRPVKLVVAHHPLKQKKCAFTGVCVTAKTLDL